MKISLLQKRRGFTLIELMVVIVILASLGAISYSVILSQKDSGDIEKSRQNLGNLGKSIEAFKDEYRSYPCDTTAEAIEDKNKGYDFGALTGDTSNCYLRQLFHHNGDLQEKEFYAYANAGGAFSKEGDGKIANGRALEKGETGFAYVMLKEDQRDPSKKGAVSNTGDPLLVAAVYPSNDPYPGEKVVFDYKTYKGKVYVYRAKTGSVSPLDNLVEDETDEERATLSEEGGFFKENRRGKSFPEKYVVLPPEL